MLVAAIFRASLGVKSSSEASDFGFIVPKKLTAGVSAKPRRRTIATISTGLLTAVGLLLLFASSPTALDYLDALASDFEIYYQRDVQPTGSVVIAAIDERSIARFGRWPWSRNLEAQLLEALGRYKVSVVGFDMVFSEPESPVSDLGFAGSMARHNPVYIGYFFSSNLTSRDTGLTIYRTASLDPPPRSYNLVRKLGRDIQEPLRATAYLPPIPELNRASAGTAYLNIDEDVDGNVRSYPTVIRFNGLYCVPLFLALADAYMGDPPLSFTLAQDGVVEVLAGTRSIPVDEMGNTTLHYRGPAGTMPQYSVADIVARRVPPHALEGKMILVGVTAPGLSDRFATPAGSDFPGVEIQATAVDSVLAGDLIRHPSKAKQEEMVASLALGAAITLSGAFSPAIVSLVLMLVLAASYLWYSLLRLAHDSTLVGFVLPWATLVITYLAVVSYRYLSEGSEKRYLRSVFELYLNRDVIASIVNNPAGLKLGGQRQHLSILFADIVDFTSRAEAAEPEMLVAMLNTYMTAMTNVILGNRGVVDKLMGDGIMAFWGAPLRSVNPARQAVDCALKMLGQLRALGSRDGRFSEIQIGIGIATGEAIVGNMGGENRFDYSAVGDTVNLASRLEGLTRIFRARILANRRTLEESGDAFVAREIGLVQVKGKQQLVPVVEIGDQADASYFARFTRAAEMLRTGSSPELELRQLLAERPEDRVALMWLERLQAVDPDGREMTFAFDVK